MSEKTMSLKGQRQYLWGHREKETSDWEILPKKLGQSLTKSAVLSHQEFRGSIDHDTSSTVCLQSHGECIGRTYCVRRSSDYIRQNQGKTRGYRRFRERVTVLVQGPGPE